MPISGTPAPIFVSVDIGSDTVESPATTRTADHG